MQTTLQVVSQSDKPKLKTTNMIKVTIIIYAWKVETNQRRRTNKTARITKYYIKVPEKENSTPQVVTKNCQS